MSEWQPIETAPEDTALILATSGGWVGEAWMLVNENTHEQEWTWAFGGNRADEKFKLLGWMPMPDHPDPTLDNEP